MTWSDVHIAELGLRAMEGYERASNPLTVRKCQGNFLK